MALVVNQLHPLFAGEIIGADLTRPPDAELVRTVEDAMAKYGISVVRKASINDDDHIRFSRAFGPLELPSRMRGSTFKGRLRPELFDASNLDANNEIIPYYSERRKLARGAERFHTDSSFNSLPTKWSLLLGHIVPPVGGDTRFIDMRVVYDDLPQTMKERIESLTGIHDFYRGRELTTGLTGVTDEQRASMPAVQHKMVRVMPYGRKSLFIGGHASGIVGWPEKDALALLAELYEFATQEKYIYIHKWQPADLVIWDNRCTMHSATPLPTDLYKRDVRRTTINEHGPEISAADARAAAMA